MNTTALVKYSGTLAALAICSACGAPSSIAPSNAGLSAYGLPVTAAYPDRDANSKSFVYVMNADGTNIFDYPKSDKQIGSIANAGTGAAEAFKYPAGGSPLATLTGSFDQPLGVVAAEK
jgi:hypothetical protein